MKKCISLILALMLVLTILTPAYAAEALLGDANSDDNVNNVDAMLILQHAVGLLTADKLNVSVCDVNGDGSVNNVDAMLVLQYAVGLLTKFPVASCSHEWVEADYQSPKTCSLCGATEGTPLVPDFEKYGLEINVKEDVIYPYVTVCYENHAYKTIGEFILYDYRTFESDDEHPAMDGYEWRAFTVDILFNDENAWNYGMSVRTCFENYYAIKDWDNSYNEETGTYTARFNGVDYTECCSIITGGLEDWVGQERLFRADYYFRVPVGYDGLVYGFYDASTEWEDGMYVYDVADENTLFFRLN